MKRPSKERRPTQIPTLAKKKARVTKKREQRAQKESRKAKLLKRFPPTEQADG